MKLAKRLTAAAILALGLAFPLRARAVIVERVVAVVGERPILLSDLRHRAIPFLRRIYAGTQDPAQRAAHESEMYQQLLTRMIEDRLEETSAERAHIAVTAEEVDNAIKNVAQANNIQPSVLVGEAKRQGLTEQDYRDELRRQLVEGKLMQLRVRSRVRVTDQDAKAAFAEYLKQTQAQVEVRILAMRIPPGADAGVAKARQLLAENLVARAREGEDFCKMVSQYSDDDATKATCGSRGALPIEGLIPDIQAAIRPLSPGQYTDPIQTGTSAYDQAILIVQLVSAPRAPKFEEVKDQMMERAFAEAMERQHKIWLEELKRGVYIDRRL